MIELNQRSQHYYLHSVDCGGLSGGGGGGSRISVEHQLLRQQIDNLTSKKRNSKKLFMSEKQLNARRKLALELMDERKTTIIHTPHNSTTLHNSQSMNVSHLVSSSKLVPQNSCSSCCSSSNDSSGSSDISRSNSSNYPPQLIARQQQQQQQQQQQRLALLTNKNDTITPPPPPPPLEIYNNLGINNNNRNDGDNMNEVCYIHRTAATATTTTTTEQHKQQHCVDKLRLLQEKLERRLYEYEFLMAQERSILKSCNRTLFLQKGINNFQYQQALHNQFVTREKSRNNTSFDRSQSSSTTSSASSSSSSASSSSSTSHRHELALETATGSSDEKHHVAPVVTSNLQQQQSSSPRSSSSCSLSSSSQTSENNHHHIEQSLHNTDTHMKHEDHAISTQPQISTADLGSLAPQQQPSSKSIQSPTILIETTAATRIDDDHLLIEKSFNDTCSIMETTLDLGEEIDDDEDDIFFDCDTIVTKL